jgi:2-methylisocitrate lyase-like PEP mutase family enzyme
MPNAWDIGSAVLLASLGFEALATTSGGFAATKGRLDGAMDRGEVLAHVAELAGATTLPLSADLENCFADEPEGVARTIAEAVDAGVAGCSVEDFTGHEEDPIYDIGLAAARVEAAAEAAHNGPARVVLTARAENYIHGRAPTWPTPSPGCRRTRRPGPTCCSPRGWTTPTSSASSWPRWTCRSACWRHRERRTSPSWRRWA